MQGTTADATDAQDATEYTTHEGALAAEAGETATGRPWGCAWTATRGSCSRRALADLLLDGEQAEVADA